MYSGENVFSNACIHRRYTFSTGIKLSPNLAITGKVLLNFKTRPILLYLYNLTKCIVSGYYTKPLLLPRIIVD